MGKIVPLDGAIARFLALGVALALAAPFAHADLELTTLDEVQPYAQVAKCEAALLRSLSAKEVKEILGNGEDKHKMQNALHFLNSLTGAGQTQRAIYFEALALQIMRESVDGWICYRFTGPSGEVGYRGSLAHAIVIARDGKIFRSWILDENFAPGNVWLGEDKLWPTDSESN